MAKLPRISSLRLMVYARPQVMSGWRCLLLPANTYFVALIAAVGGMLFCFDISSMSAIVITEQYIDYFDNPHGIVQGAIGSALAAGSIVGSLMAGPISDRWGRCDRNGDGYHEQYTSKNWLTRSM
jgi:MFS family permease